MKRTGNSKKTKKQYTYYCCEHLTSRDEKTKCDFMTWDVPVQEDCPLCGHTMFKRAGRGRQKPFCINPECADFLPEEKRGYRPAKKEDPAASAQEAEPPAGGEAKKRTRSTAASKRSSTAKVTADVKEKKPLKKASRKKSSGED